MLFGNKIYILLTPALCCMYFVVAGVQYWITLYLVKVLMIDYSIAVLAFIDRLGVKGFSLQRLATIPSGFYGMTIAHIGMGLFVIGATAETAARSERTFALASGQSAEMFGWNFRFDGVHDAEGPNYYPTVADITVTHDGRSEVIHPEKRFYPVANMSTTEVSIRKTPGGDVYVALGDTLRDEPGVWRIRIAKHPLIDWVWSGAGLIALGGFLSLAARIRRRAPASEQAPLSQPASAGEAPEPAGVTA